MRKKQNILTNWHPFPGVRQVLIIQFHTTWAIWAVCSCHTICEVQTYCLKLLFFLLLHFLKEVTWKMFYTFRINQHFSPFHSLTESWVLSSRRAFAQFSLASHGIVWLASHVTDKYCASPLSSGSAYMDLHCTSHSRLSWHPASGFLRVL